MMLELRSGSRKCIRIHLIPMIETLFYLIVYSFLTTCSNCSSIKHDNQPQVFPTASLSSHHPFNLPYSSATKRVRRLADEEDQRGRLRILPDEKKHRAEMSNPLILTCQGENQDPGYFSDFQWYDKNGELVDPRRSRYRLEPGEGLLSLVISDTELSDSGVYRCVASFQRTRRLEATIEIDIYKGISWDDCPLEQYLIAGRSNEKIVCKVSSLPTSKITWEKDDRPLNKNEYSLTSDGIVVKNPVTNATAGSFKVTASILEYGILKNRVIRVQVNEMPMITFMDPHKEIVEGERATIQCRASGAPPPFYHFIDAQRRNLSLEAGYRVDKINGELFIESVRKDRDESVECLVINSAGRDSRQMKLRVLTKPTLVEFRNRSMVEGFADQWSCRVRGDPAPRIEFARMDHSVTLDRLDEKPLQLNDRFRFESIKLSNEEVEYKLIVDRVERKDDGLYLCKANNSAGAASFVGHIEVQYPPDLSDTNTNIRTWSNNPVNLTCIAHSIPNATFFWRFLGQDIRPDDEAYTIYDEVGISRLLVRPNIGRSVYGIYTCRASNSRGERSVSINLKEVSAPYIPNVRLLSARPTAFEFEISDLTPELPIKNYYVKYWHDLEVMSDAKTIRWPAGSKIYKLSGLTPRTRYKLIFAAENDVGIGAYTEFKRFDTYHETRPDKVAYVYEENQDRDLTKDGFVRSDSGDQFKFRWHPVEDNGRQVKYYTVNYYKVYRTGDTYSVTDDKYSERIVSASSSLEYTLKNLRPNTFYKIQLFATNEIGRSDPSDLIFRTSGGELLNFSFFGFHYLPLIWDKLQSRMNLETS